MPTNSAAVSTEISQPATELQGAVPRSEFRNLLKFVDTHGVTTNGVDILREGTIISPGIAELRGALGPYTYTRLPTSRQRIYTLNLLELATTIKDAAPDASLIVEPRFYRNGLWRYHGAPLECIRSIVFRLVKDDEEIFRADLREGNNSHLSSIRTFYYDDNFSDLSYSLIERGLGRTPTYRDFDKNLITRFVEGVGAQPEITTRKAPKLDIDQALIGNATYSYSTRQLSQDKAAWYAQQASELTNRLYSRAAIIPNFEVLGATNNEVTVVMYSSGLPATRAIQSKLDELSGMLNGRLERHPPHNLWIGINSPDITPRSFLRQAEKMENYSLRFELNELQPRLSYEEFLQLPRFPELGFYSPESKVSSGRTVVALQDHRGYFIQYNPNTIPNSAYGDQGVQIFKTRVEADNALNSCALIFGGNDHPNLASRKPIFELLPANKLERLQGYISRFYS